MRRVDREEVRRLLSVHAAKGHKVNSRLTDTIEKPGELYIVRLEDESAFLSLIWQRCKCAPQLNPINSSRTLRDVAERFLASKSTFDSLPAKWFTECVAIDKEFSYDNIGLIAVVPANNDEQSESPNGTFYLYDGNHRAFVLAVRLLSRQTVYQPVDLLYLVPRR